MDVREISSQGRDATGVRIMNLDDGQTVASVEPIIADYAADMDKKGFNGSEIVDFTIKTLKSLQ